MKIPSNVHMNVVEGETTIGDKVVGHEGGTEEKWVVWRSAPRE